MPDIKHDSELLNICNFVIHVFESEDKHHHSVMIGSDKNPAPPEAILAATEHMMTLFALQGQDFERSLELLCQGARENKVRQLGQVKTQ